MFTVSILLINFTVSVPVTSLLSSLIMAIPGISHTYITQPKLLLHIFAADAYVHQSQIKALICELLYIYIYIYIYIKSVCQVSVFMGCDVELLGIWFLTM